MSSITGILGGGGGGGTGKLLKSMSSKFKSDNPLKSKFEKSGVTPGKNPLGSGVVGGGVNTGSGAGAGAGAGAEVFESACPNEAK